MKPLTLMESIFFKLLGLNPLVGLFTDFNHTKSKSYSRNNNVSNRLNIGDSIDNEVPWVDGLPFINLN